MAFGSNENKITVSNPMFDDDSDQPAAEEDVEQFEAADEEEVVFDPTHDEEHQALVGKSCGLFAADNSVRQAVHVVAYHPLFGGLVLTLISANFLVLALQGPRHTYGQGFDDGVYWFDWTVSVIFTLEMIMKMFSDGVIGCHAGHSGRGAYLHNPWNLLDFLVIVGLWTSHIMMQLNPGSPRIKAEALRIIRIIRPLRSLRICAGLTGLMRAMYSALPYLFIVFQMLAFFVVVFGLMGTQLFGGAVSRTCSSEPPFKNILLSRMLVPGNISKVLGGVAQGECPLVYDCASCDVARGRVAGSALHDRQ